MARMQDFFLALGLTCILVTPPAAAGRQEPILSASEIDHPPFCIVDDQGRADGFSVELMRAALKAMGREVTFRTGPWAEVRGLLKRGEVQVLPLGGRTPEPEFLFDFTFPYMSLKGAIVVRQDTKNIQDLNDLRDRTVSVKKGDSTEEFLRREDRGIHIHTTTTFEEALRELSKGRYDTVIIQRLVALRLIQETGLVNLKVINRPTKGFRQDFCFAVKEGDRETLALFNEGLKVLKRSGEQRRIYEKWLGVYKEEPLLLIRALYYSAMVLIPLALLFLGFFLWPWSLRRQVPKRETELAAASERPQAILGAIPDIIMEVDADKIYTWANPTGIEFFGEDVIGREASEFFIGEQNTYDTVKPLFNGNENVIYVESWQRRRDGEKRLLAWWCRVLKDEMGEAIGSLSTARDITEQKQTEEALQQSEANYRLLVESQTDLVVKVDLEGRFLFISPSYCRLFGKKEEDLLGKKFTPLVHEEDRGPTEEAMKALYSPPHTAYIEQRVMTKEGWLWLEWADTAVLDSSGNVKEIIGVGRDITKRKQSEEEIQKRDIQCKKLASQVPGMIYQFMQKPDGSLCIPFTSEGIRDIFGCLPQDVKDDFSPIAKVILPEDLDLVTSSIKKSARQLTPWFCEYRVQTPGQSVRWIEGHSIPEKLDDGSIIWHGFNTDITERKQAEKALRESEKRYRDLFENSTDFVFTLDLKGTFTDVNKAAEDLTGYTKDELIGMNYRDYIPVDDHEKILRAFKSVFNEVKPLKDFPLEVIIKGGAGRYFETCISPLMKEGEVIGFQGISRDVTERLRVQEERENLQAQLSNALEMARLGHWEYDVAGDVFTFNDHFYKIFRTSAAEVGGYTLSSAEYTRRFVHPDDMSVVGEETRKAIESADPNFKRQFGHRIIYADGSVGHISVRFFIVKDAWGKTVRTYGVNQDITEWKKLEEESLKVQKLESLGVLAGGIAHDFNNTLTTIMGNIALARDQASAGDDFFDLLQEAELGATRAQGLTRQLLTFARGGVPIKETASLKDILQESSLFMLRGSKSRCEFSIKDDLWLAEVDTGQISQVIQNVVINANQAMPEGGLIRVAAENSIIPDGQALPIRPGRYIRISITDQGTGIAGKHLSKIFDPYFTTRQRGSGLGLATSFSIIKKHGGHITVESRPEGGTTFHIYLPTSDKAVPKKKESEEVIEIWGRILVMDDEAPLRKILGRMLANLGYEAKLAKDGAEAVRMVEEAGKSGEPFAAVILDLTVPGGMGGKETIRRLLEIDPGIKAIVSSGYSNDPVLANFQEYGFKGMIPKPFDLRLLGKVLHEVTQSDVDRD